MHSLYDLKSCAQMKCSERIIGLAAIMLLASIFMFSLGRQASHTQAATVEGQPHLASIPYYSIKGDWDSILNLNNSISDPLAVSLTLYSFDGDALQLPDISLLANDTATVRLSELIAQSGDKKGRFQEGSVELRFNHNNGMALASQLTVLDSKHGLSFDIEPPMGFKSSTLEALWWSPDDKTSGQIMLSNTTAERLDVHLDIEWRSVVIPSPAIFLSSRQTIVLDIEKLLKSLGVKAKGIERGGLSISHSGAPGALIAQGVVLNKERHFASNLGFVDVLAQNIPTLNATGLLLGHHRSGSAFAEQSFFTPQLALKNTTKSTQSVTVKVQYTANGRLSTKALPVVNLSPHEVGMVDFSRFVESLRNVPVDSAGLRLEHTGAPGSVIASLTSVDRSQSIVVDAPLVSRSERAGLGGNHPFRLDENYQSILYLTNITGKSTKALIVIFHEGGLYTPELIQLAAGETKAIDLLEIRNSQAKDVQERTLPPNLTKGQLFWHPHEGEALIGRVVVVDKASGTASNFSCQSCCGQEPINFVVTPLPLIGPPGNFTQMNVNEWDTLCGQMTLGPYNVTNSCKYVSNNTSVATVNATGRVTYAGVGATTVTMSVDYFRSDAISAEDCGMFPATFAEDCAVQTVDVSIESFLGVGKDQSVNVPITLMPSPTMSNVTLTLRTTSGTGSAKFASNNSTTLNINQSTSVAIKGVTESSTADNIILEAKVNGSVIESETFSVVLVTLSLRTSGSVSTDNAARGEYMARIISSASLGTLFSTGTNAHEWRTNVEIVGTVKPSNYAGSVRLEREIVERRIYDNMTLFIDGVVTNQPDNSLQEFLDDNPQSGGSSGKVYDLDGPSIASTSSTPLNAIRRRRTNFRQWATIDGVQASDPRVRTSADFAWFQRLSIIKTASGDQLRTDVSGDNIAGTGTTKLTWNLQ